MLKDYRVYHAQILCRSSTVYRVHHAQILDLYGHLLGSKRQPSTPIRKRSTRIFSVNLFFLNFVNLSDPVNLKKFKKIKFVDQNLLPFISNNYCVKI